MSELLQHRRSSNFVDEFVDEFTPIAMSWNGSERLHVTFGRNSLEVTTEDIIPNPENPLKATTANHRVSGYRHDVASLTIPMEVAERLALTLLKMVDHSKKRGAKAGDS